MAEPVARGVVHSGKVASVTINQERVRGTLNEADQRIVGAIGGDKFELPRSFPPRMTRLSAIVRAICRRVRGFDRHNVCRWYRWSHERRGTTLAFTPLWERGHHDHCTPFG